MWPIVSLLGELLRQHSERLWQPGCISRLGVCSHVPSGHWVAPRRGVTFVHRGRFGGNARKRKTKLTDASFHAVIGTQVQSDGQVIALVHETSLIEVVISDEEVLDDDLDFVAPDFVSPGYIPLPSPIESVVLPIRRIQAQGQSFACQDYEFGYAICGSCHNDQAYYVHRADLVDGYTFRCRVCRLQMTVFAKQ
jgi:hypothetical protein